MDRSRVGVRRLSPVALIVALLAAMTLAPGCSFSRNPAATKAPSSSAARLHGTLVQPPVPPPAQVLTDTTGQAFSVAGEARRRLALLFFGYTHCPDVCPSTMADLAAARQLLPAEARERVTVIFVTEDPTRDTPGALRRWLDRLDPAFVGLIGGNSASREMLKQLYLPETTQNARPQVPVSHPSDHGSGRPHDDHGSYGVDHSGIVYAFTPQGQTVLYSGGTTAEQYAADLTALLGGR